MVFCDNVVTMMNTHLILLLICREVAKGLMKYQPDVIISVHPLMQHVPLRILRAKGLLKKIVFTTVITDLSTCHPTWSVNVVALVNTDSQCGSDLDFSMPRFHKLVTRCYCPSAEVAKRALKAGLQPSQIKVYGLPVRPSFVKPVRPKVGDLVSYVKLSYLLDRYVIFLTVSVIIFRIWIMS